MIGFKVDASMKKKLSCDRMLSPARTRGDVNFLRREDILILSPAGISAICLDSFSFFYVSDGMTIDVTTWVKSLLEMPIVLNWANTYKGRRKVRERHINAVILMQLGVFDS